MPFLVSKRTSIAGVLIAIAAVTVGGCSGGSGAAPQPAPQKTATSSPTTPASTTPTSPGTPMMSPTPAHSGSPSPTSTPTPTGHATATPTPGASPTAAASGAFADWPMYQNDAQHDGYVNDAAMTPASIGSLHLAWEHIGLEQSTSHEQPVVATNVAGHAAVLYLGGAYTGNVYSFDGTTGQSLWVKNVGFATPVVGSQAGVRGTGAIDRVHSVIYVPDGQHRIHALSLSGLADTISPVDIAPTSPPDTNAIHNLISVGMTLGPNGTLYAATGSASDESPWVGRVAAVDTNSGSLLSTFYTVFDPNSAKPYSGGGIWSWGGATLDGAGNVYVDAGNADPNADSPFAPAPDQEVGYAEHTLELSPSLGYVNSALPPAASYTSQSDMDFAGTPIVFQPVGCGDPLIAVSGKSGRLSIYDTTILSANPLMTLAVAEISGTASAITNPSFSPRTGLLYVSITDTATAYANGQPGMIAVGFSGCAPSIAWNPGTAFGVSSFIAEWQRSAPTVTSGGVVLVMAPINAAGTGALFALDASSGAMLNGGKPIFTANGPGRMAPVVDGNWIWLSDSAGDIYGLTTSTSVPALRNPSAVHRTLAKEVDRS